MPARNCYRSRVRIRIEGSSSPFAPERLAQGVFRLRQLGLDVHDGHAGPRGRHAYLNGDDNERLASLQAALSSDVDVVWLARGGYGLGRIVSRLQVPERMPRVVGFSDATALFCGLLRAGQLARCVHGPLVTTLAAEPEVMVDRVVDIVRGGLPPPLVGLVSLAGPSALDVSGPLFAGNVCVMASLCGTSSQPRFGGAMSGAIVVLEEIGERPYRLDRMLTQLVDAGVFDGVAAIVVGHMTQCSEPTATTTAAGTSRAPAPSPLEVIVDVLGPLQIPIVAGAPVGHEHPNAALPLGIKVRLHGEGNDVRLAWSGEMP
jgi:muramoyltetrapeptide carboxypeptidase